MILHTAYQVPGTEHVEGISLERQSVPTKSGGIIFYGLNFSLDKKLG